MPLSNVEIWEALASGDLVIEPMPEARRIGPSSIDLLLHPDLLVIPDRVNGIIAVPSEVDIMDLLNRYGRPFTITDATPYKMEPHKFIIGKTVETVTLSNQLSARIEGKSSLARLGLSVHVTAPTVIAGFSGPLYLELYNIGAFDVHLLFKMQIAQLIIERLGTPATEGYAGQFQHQR